MSQKKTTIEQKIIIALIVMVVVTVIVYAVRSQSKEFRDAMDKYIPINPFNMANIVLKAQQEKFVKDLHPDVQWRFRAFIKEVEDSGWSVIATSGYRDFQKQFQLHRQNPKNARPGRSHHNYGLALDINATKGKIALRKASSEKAWVSSGIPAIAKKHGLSWQYRFGTYVDPIHFYYKADTAKLLQRGIAQFGSDEKIIGNQVALS